MFIQTVPTADHCSKLDFNGKTAVVIDVLRASSVIITALANGAENVLPTSSTAEAFKLYRKLGSEAILGGERNAEIIEGFHYGNSPLQYTPEIVGSKQLILNTTNGTRAIKLSSKADKLVIGALINLDAIINFLVKKNNDLVLVCSGTNGKFSLDDALCAGLIADHIFTETKSDCCDLTHLLINYVRQSGSIQHKLQNCFHLKYLMSIGYAKDVEYCLKLNVFDMVPHFDGYGIVGTSP